ncbi:MAG: DMT family transporter, partial [Alphaproteobacteria bacterium]|nr:DMT family transporter [Alphaproteobacteria bacterium]
MAASERRKFLYGAGAGVLAALIWGGYFPVSRLVLRDSALSPEDVAFLRFCIAGVVFLPVLLRHGLKAGRAGWLGSVILTLTVGFPYAFAMALGLGFAPASHGAISVPGMFPVLTAILGFLVLRDPLGARRLVGVGLVLAGVVGVGWHALWQDQLGQWQGYALFFMCGWMWAAFSVTARIASISAVHVTAILSVGSLAVFGPIYGLFGDIQLLELPMGEFLFQLVYQGLGVGVVA